MKCHVIILDMTGTTYTSIYEIEKRRETIKEKTKKEDKSKEKKKKMKKKNKIEETNCRAPPPQASWQTLT